MNFKKIETEDKYKAMLEWIDTQFDSSPASESPEGVQLKLALAFIKAYEDINYPIPSIQL